MSVPVPTYLDLARAARHRVESQLAALNAETNPLVVLGVYYPDKDRAKIARDRIIERAMRDLERLEDAIVRVMRASVPVVPDDAHGIGYGTGGPDICQDCGEPMADDDAFLCAECTRDLMAARKREADEMAAERTEAA